MNSTDLVARHTKQIGTSLDHVVIRDALKMRDRLVEMLDRVRASERRLELLRLGLSRLIPGQCQSTSTDATFVLRLGERLGRVTELEGELEQIRLDAVPVYCGGLDD